MSEQLQTDEELRDEELTEAAWDAQRDTFFLFEPSTGKAVRWNRAFREITGYTDEEIAAKPAPESYYSAEDIERANVFLRKLVETKTGTIELELICKDGRRVPTEYNASVVLDAEGAPSYLISIGRDVTERRRAEQQVRMHRERLQGFMDSATDSFHLLDADFGIIEINEKAMEALREAIPGIGTKEDVVGRSLFDVYPFMRGDGGENLLRSVIETGQPMQFDSHAEHPIRGTVYMTVQVFKVGDDLGIIATDISERKRAEEERLDLERQIQHAQKLESLGILAGGIAHDFNNLLVGVLGGTDLALQYIDPSSPARELLEDVANVAHRAADLANQMLAYSGKGRFIVEPIDLSLLVEEMHQLIEASAAKKIHVSYDLEDDLPAVEIDVTQIRQIVLNLVINAAEAIGDGIGTVSLSTGAMPCDQECLADLYLGNQAEEGTYVYLQVKDTGEGMDEGAVGRIFDPFFTTKITGRGLGLAAVQGIVRGHRGAIKVDSEPQGGTTMTVLFPASEKPALNRPESRFEEDNWTGRGVVLLVDDEEIVRSVGAAMLKRLGFEVLMAEDGRQSLEVFRRHADDIVLVCLDLAMPEMSGEDVFREMRQIKGDVKVLLSSGFDEQEVTERFAGDLDGFVQKPYRLETLRRKIREILAP